METGRSGSGTQASPAASCAAAVVPELFASDVPPLAPEPAPEMSLCAAMDSGEYWPGTRFSGAPDWTTAPPGVSPRVRVAGAVPVFCTVTAWVALLPQATVLSMDAGVSVNWPAVRLRSRAAVPSGGMVAVAVAEVYFDAAAVTGCLPAACVNDQ